MAIFTFEELKKKLYYNNIRENSIKKVIVRNTLNIPTDIYLIIKQQGYTVIKYSKDIYDLGIVACGEKLYKLYSLLENKGPIYYYFEVQFSDVEELIYQNQKYNLLR